MAQVANNYLSIQAVFLKLDYALILLILKGQSPSDYTTVSSTQTFTSGSRNGTTRCIDINIVDNDIFEGNQYFIVKSTIRNPHVMLGVAVSNITILDYDGMHAAC